MNQTANVGLPTWEKTDPVRMTDFNAMTSALDAAIVGRCHLEIGSYTGSGTGGQDHDPNTLSFSKRPVAVIFPYGHGNRLVLNVEGEQSFYADGSYTCIAYTWSGNTLSWIVKTTGDQSLLARYQMNTTDQVYYYLALYQG